MTLFAGGGGIFIDKPTHSNGVIVWKQIADRQFALNIVQISYGNNGNSSNNINENGTVKIKCVVTLNDVGDSLSVIATGQGLDLDGQVIDSFSVTLTATRVQFEPI